MIHDQLLAQTSRAIFDKKQINEDPDLRWMAAAALLPSWTSQQKAHPTGNDPQVSGLGEVWKILVCLSRFAASH